MVAGGVPGGILRFGPFRLDLQQRLLFRDAEPLHLPPKTLDLLAVLAAEPQRVIAKTKLVQAVWPDVTVEEGNLTKGIHLLRKTLGQRPDGGEWIETVSKRGYRLAADVVHENASPAPPAESAATALPPSEAAPEEAVPVGVH